MEICWRKIRNNSPTQVLNSHICESGSMRNDVAKLFDYVSRSFILHFIIDTSFFILPPTRCISDYTNGKLPCNPNHSVCGKTLYFVISNNLKQLSILVNLLNDDKLSKRHKYKLIFLWFCSNHVIVWSIGHNPPSWKIFGTWIIMIKELKQSSFKSDGLSEFNELLSFWKDKSIYVVHFLQ